MVRQNGNEVVVREETATGIRDVIVPRSEIEDLIETVSPERLAALDPSRPQEYREYAEELAEKKLDPEARLMAVRLFQIAAWLDPAKTGHGALLGLVSVARPGEEEARYRAAAYLFDPRHNKALLGQTSIPPARPPRKPTRCRAYSKLCGSFDAGMTSRPARRWLLRGQRRTGRLSRQSSRARSFWWPAAAKELSDEQLRKVLELELTLDSRLERRGGQAGGNDPGVVERRGAGGKPGPDSLR